MVDITYNENEDGSGVLSLTGELVLANVDDIKNALLSAIGSTNNLRLNIIDVIDIDLSCIQLLCAAHRFAIRQKKQLSFDLQPHELLREAVRVTGVARHKGCILDVNDSCLWLRDWS
ncbi:MAG: STAS domain-containing protein [Nitrospirae bacterium]|nr:STAS domain-containing protein [Nitrospirota bacterium]